MRASDDEAAASDKRDRSRPFFVSLGIALFIAGFVTTVVFSTAGSMDQPETLSEGSGASAEGSSSTFESTMAFIGIFIGLLGVVTATVGPLTTVVAKGRR